MIICLLWLLGTLSPQVSFGQTGETSPTPLPTAADTKLKTAIFSGGCFWCMQYTFDNTKGVKKTVVGFTGGRQKIRLIIKFHRATPDMQNQSKFFMIQKKLVIRDF